MIEVNQAVIRYPNHRIGPVSLTIQRQERLAILGPSGAGKSSFLHLISGMMRVQEGSVALNRVDLSAWTLRQLSRVRAVLPQSYDSMFNLEVGLIVSLARVARDEIVVSRELVGNCLELVKASHLMNRSFHQLSGGEKARVQLARVFCQLWDCESGYLMMDEPIASLDPGLQVQILDAATEFCSQRRLAMIAVMHDINYAVQYFERIMMIRSNGNIEIRNVDEELTKSFEALYGLPIERYEHPNQGARYLPRMATSI